MVLTVLLGHLVQIQENKNNQVEIGAQGSNGIEKTYLIAKQKQDLLSGTTWKFDYKRWVSGTLLKYFPCF